MEITRYFAEDHRRLERLLERAATPEHVDVELFQPFRAGLLRHIGIEEKLLIPAARRAGGGPELAALARRIRFDHGAIASLLVPTPTPAVVARLRSVLEPHNELEEGSGGLYEMCERLAASDAAELLSRCRSYPEPPLRKHRDSERVWRHIEDNLRLAGR